MQKLNDLCDAAGVARAGDALAEIVESRHIICESYRGIHWFIFHGKVGDLIIEVKVNTKIVPMQVDIVRYMCNGINVHLSPNGTFDEQLKNLVTLLNL